MGNAETHRDHGAFSTDRVPNARPDDSGPAVIARGGVAHPRGLARPAALVPAHRARSLPRRPHDPAQPLVCQGGENSRRKSAAGCLARRVVQPLASCDSSMSPFCGETVKISTSNFRMIKQFRVFSPLSTGKFDRAATVTRTKSTRSDCRRAGGVETRARFSRPQRTPFSSGAKLMNSRCVAPGVATRGSTARGGSGGWSVGEARRDAWLVVRG